MPSLQPRLLRTYSRRGGRVRPLPKPDRWLSPPQDRKRFFSSTSTGSTAASSSALSGPSDDPDFSPPGKRLPHPLGKRPARPRRLRTRRGGGAKEKAEEKEKENQPRPAGPAAAATPPSPPPPRARRRRPGPQRPLLCSTPQWPPRRRAPLRPRALLGTTLESGSGLSLSPELFSAPRRQLRASARNAPSSLEASWGDTEQLPPVPGAEGGPGQPSPAWQNTSSDLRAAVWGPCQAQAALSPQKATTSPEAVLSPIDSEPESPVPRDRASPRHPRDRASPEHPRDDLSRGSSASSCCQRDLNTYRLTPLVGQNQYQLTPVVVLDHQEVAMWLKGVKRDTKMGTQGAHQQPASPLGLQGIPENGHRNTKVNPGGGSTCRKVCISGSSASRWGRQIRLRPVRHKNKRQQQPNNSLFRPQMRRKRTKKGVLERSVDKRDNDCSFLNSSSTWGRVRASLSFHKKKKITTEESFCSSIFCTPSVKSQLSGYQETPSAAMAQYCTWSASSMILLAPRNASSVLELTLTDAEKVFGECQQEGPITFEECIPLDKMKDCEKIGEGVFGEVFQIDSERGPVALKIIPIEGTERVNGEAQKSFGEILPEVIISKELSLLSEESENRTVGFISLYSVHCVQGAYPKYLLEAWDKYHEVTGSENDRPDLFGDKQLFMVLEFEFGGSDLEKMRNQFSSVTSAKSILHQVTASLAVAEQELHFEHRDLHWGNVLVKKTEEKELGYVLNGATHTIPTAGIHVNIIDYTLSRLEKDGLTVFCDLSTDEELFQGTGDYQFDIYRQMKAENSNSWTDYHPHSNVLWLHYLSDKLLNDVCYKKKASTSAMKKIKQQLIKFHKEVLTFESANEVLQKSSLFQ
ncbi:serine/threonine-protein kinase haspin [Aegotheles albertisi]